MGQSIYDRFIVQQLQLEEKMKRYFKFIGLGVLIIGFLAGCSKPKMEMDAATAAVEAAITEGADIYAKPEIERLQADLTAAMDAVEAENQRLFKSFGDTRVMLTAVATTAEELKATIPARKEAAKNASIAAMEKAKAAVEEAKALLATAPKGKGTKADIEAFTADLQGLEDMMPEITSKMGNEDYLGASESSKLIMEKATGISDQIKLAIEKVKR